MMLDISRCKDCGKPSPTEFCNEACKVDYEKIHTDLLNGDATRREPHRFDENGAVVVNSTCFCDIEYNAPTRPHNTPAQRNAAALRYKEGERISKIARDVGVSGTAISKWIHDLYPGLIEKRRADEDAWKCGIALRALNGESPTSLAREIGVDRSVIRKWRLKYTPEILARLEAALRGNDAKRTTVAR